MAVFDINLLKGRAISAPVRKAMFWGLSLYLVICICLTAYLANWATQRLIRAARLGRTIDQEEKAFLREHPEDRDVLAFASRSQRRLTSDAESLELIDKMIRCRVNLVAVISGLTAHLPARVYLLNFELVPKGRVIEFDVAIPAGGMERTITAGQLMGGWNGDDALKASIEPVRAVSTKRQRVLGQSALVMRFSAKLK